MRRVLCICISAVVQEELMIAVPSMCLPCRVGILEVLVAHLQAGRMLVAAEAATSSAATPAKPVPQVTT